MFFRFVRANLIASLAAAAHNNFTKSKLLSTKKKSASFRFFFLTKVEKRELFFERDRAEFLLKERPPKRSNARFLTLNILQARFSDSKLNFNSKLVFKKSILRFYLSYLYQQVNKGIRKALKRTEGTLLIHSHAYKSFQYYFILVLICINNTFFKIENMNLVMFYSEFSKKELQKLLEFVFSSSKKTFCAIIILILIVFIIMLVHYEELGRVYMSYDQKGHLSK